ncbi:response regulator [Rhizobium azibense]|uniref:Response regulator receiver domain-containing protein n=2 Tax=Rhizobium TaxID=379 RepID=A0A4V6P1A9_9HYPH|nr:response regulator [Rhizobium azibense]TCU33535.1 response regulator receiver domain-containing protein [Rhizobium azibense]
MSRILIVEDEMLIAFTLEAMLVDLGHEVVAIARRLDEALEMVKTTTFDIAVLDLKLGTEMTFPVADLLIELKKNFIFSTGFDEAELDGRYSQPVLEKPYDEARLVELTAWAS